MPPPPPLNLYGSASFTLSLAELRHRARVAVHQDGPRISMSSRRKASTPCMIRPEQNLVELDDEEPQDMEVSYGVNQGSLILVPEGPARLVIWVRWFLPIS